MLAGMNSEDGYECANAVAIAYLLYRVALSRDGCDPTLYQWLSKVLTRFEVVF